MLVWILRCRKVCDLESGEVQPFGLLRDTEDCDMTYTNGDKGLGQIECFAAQ